MRFPWQCPTCYAQLDEKSRAKVSVCPYCGSVLVVDAEKKKFYLAKRKDGKWYYFPRVDIGERTGYLKFGNTELFFLLDEDEWYLCMDGALYHLEGEGNCMATGVYPGEVERIWGDIPILALPDMRIEMETCTEGILLKTSRDSAFFRRV